MGAELILRSFLLLGLLGGCTSAPTTPVETGSSLAVPAALVSATWQVRMAVAENRAPFEGRDAWIQYFQGHRGSALQGFASDGDKPALARLHGEYAAMYRQATLAAAWSFVQTYGTDAQETDPKEMTTLVGISGVLLKTPEWSAKLGSTPGTAISAADTEWKTWLEQGAHWPPPLTGAPNLPGKAETGKLPDAGALPHWTFKHQGEEGSIETADLRTLLALSLYHEEAAKLADPASAAIVDALLNPWRLPVETPVSTSTALSDPFLFMSVYTSSGDALFMADLASEGASAIEKHQSDSAAAVIVKTCRKDAVIDVDCVLDQATALTRAIVDGMKQAAGKEDSFYRPFSEYARIGILRAGDRAAAVIGDRDDMGRLRVNALDRSIDAARDPLFLLSVSAWDAGNRNSLRCADLLHALIPDIPGLEAVRLPVDALQIRVGRNAAPSHPMH